MLEIFIKEQRSNILLGILIMVIMMFLVGGLAYALLDVVELFEKTYHWQFIIIVTLLILGVKDCIFMLCRLLAKIISPCSIKFNNFGFECSELNQFFEWNKIDKFEYMVYDNIFETKSNFIAYAGYMILTSRAIATIVEILKNIIFKALGTSKIVLIKTQNKKELLKKANIILKFKNIFLPKNIVLLDIDLDLSHSNYDEKTPDAILIAKNFQNKTYNAMLRENNH